MSPTARARLRVLVSAYACGPGDEPEAAAGWAFATAAATDHDVVVVTRRRFEGAVTAALAADPELARHLRVVHLECHPTLLAAKRGRLGIYWYYVLWQRELRRLAARLHHEQPFDVVHHVTFANDWLPCGLVGATDAPLVWGPVGGASASPLRLARWLGVRGTLTEIARESATRPVRRLWGDAAARAASVVVAQNDDVAHRFRSARHVVVEANASLAPEDVDLVQDAASVASGSSTGRRRAVYVGRLISLKGVRIAVAAMSDTALADWDLDIYGEGYERSSLERQVHRLGLTDRVRFLGHRPRTEVLSALAHADALVFPSMHDQAGWVAAEASALGCPVVCLPFGGPPVLADVNAHVVPLEKDLPAALARAVAALPRGRGPRSRRWDAGRLPGFLARVYGLALPADPQESPAAGPPVGPGGR
ncbi:glycosyltransferase [Cellulosimicrobium terreum]|nr:glycosyltransferase [Cellulosimicrobium terreum]